MTSPIAKEALEKHYLPEFMTGKGSGGWRCHSSVSKLKLSTTLENWFKNVFRNAKMYFLRPAPNRSNVDFLDASNAPDRIKIERACEVNSRPLHFSNRRPGVAFRVEHLDGLDELVMAILAADNNYLLLVKNARVVVSPDWHVFQGCPFVLVCIVSKLGSFRG